MFSYGYRCRRSGFRYRFVLFMAVVGFLRGLEFIGKVLVVRGFWSLVLSEGYFRDRDDDEKG